MKLAILGIVAAFLWAGTCGAADWHGHLETEQLSPNLRDRGEGLPTSMFGIYIQKGQFMFYPFFEYYRNHDQEYSPNELGKSLDQDFRGEYSAYEGLIFLGYGITEWLAVEMEAAYIQAKLKPSSEDPTGLPSEIEETGIGDVEGQIRWRWAKETASRPEFFSYFETVFPTADEGSLIGTTDFEFKLGVGVVRGYSWGTVTARGAVEYDLAEDAGALGELAIEYLRRINDQWRIFAGFEGTQDEVEMIPEVQWHMHRNACLKANSAFGVTSKAADWAPEIGLLLTF